MNIDQDNTLSVYYNSACSVCNAGIKLQRKKNNLRDIAWKDIGSNNQIVKEIGKELPVVRKYLHVRDGHQIYIGIDAFIKLWQSSPTDYWKAKVIALPLIKQLSVCLYIIFANSLYALNKRIKRW